MRLTIRCGNAAIDTAVVQSYRQGSYQEGTIEPRRGITRSRKFATKYET